MPQSSLPPASVWGEHVSKSVRHSGNYYDFAAMHNPGHPGVTVLFLGVCVLSRHRRIDRVHHSGIGVTRWPHKGVRDNADVRTYAIYVFYKLFIVEFVVCYSTRGDCSHTIRR